MSCMLLLVIMRRKGGGGDYSEYWTRESIPDARRQEDIEEDERHLFNLKR